MKNISLFLVLFFFVLTGCGPKMTPIEYNDAIIGEQTKMTKILLKMTGEFQAMKFDESEITRQELVKQCDAAIEALKKLPDYDGNTHFRDAGIALFTFHKDVSSNEYKEMIDILRKGKDITEVDIIRLTQLEQTVADRERVLNEEFKQAQQEFAEQQKISLIENEIQKEIDKLGK